MTQRIPGVVRRQSAPTTHAEEQAQIVAAARARAADRYLSAAEQQQVATLASLSAPAGDAPAGVTKLLDGVARLPLGGSPDEYVRDKGGSGETSFVRSDARGAKTRVIVTPEGLLRVESVAAPLPHRGARRRPTWAVSSLFDLRGARVNVGRHQQALDVLVGQERAHVESELMAGVLEELGTSSTSAAGAGGAEHMTLGEVVALTDPGKRGQPHAYLQQSGTPLEAKVKAAFDELRDQFQSYLRDEAAGKPTDDPQVANAFADKLNPALSQSVDAAADALAKAKAKVTEAETQVLSAREAVTAREREIADTPHPRRAMTHGLERAQRSYAAAVQLLAGRRRTIAAREAGLQWVTSRRDNFRQEIRSVLNAPSTKRLAFETIAKLCNVISYFLYAQIVGIIPKTLDFKDYYLAQVEAGNISQPSGEEGVFLGSGSEAWDKALGLGGHVDDRRLPALNHTSRKAELDAFLASGANVAITHQDVEPGRSPHRPGHFFLIVKDEHGVWRNLDHTSHEFARRGGITDWARVYRIIVDQALIDEAKARLRDDPRPATPASR